MILYSRNIAVENNIIRKSFAVDHQKKKKKLFCSCCRENIRKSIVRCRVALNLDNCHLKHLYVSIKVSSQLTYRSTATKPEHAIPQLRFVRQGLHDFHLHVVIWAHGCEC